MNKRFTVLVIVLAIIVGALLVLTNPFKKQESPFIPKTASPSSEDTQKIPEFELEDFSGQKVKMASALGKPIFIDFWAAWCPYCVSEMPEIEKIHQEFGDRLAVYGIHRSETEGIDDGSKFARERGVTYPLLKDSTGAVYKTLTGGRNFMPYALYIDKEGNIVKTKAGPKTAEEMRRAIEELIQ